MKHGHLNLIFKLAQFPARNWKQGSHHFFEPIFSKLSNYGITYFKIILITLSEIATGREKSFIYPEKWSIILSKHFSSSTL